MKTTLSLLAALALAVPMSAMAGRNHGHGRHHDRDRSVNNDNRNHPGGDDYWTCTSMDMNGEAFQVASPGNHFAIRRHALNACLDSSEVPDSCVSVDCTRL